MENHISRKLSGYDDVVHHWLWSSRQYSTTTNRVVLHLDMNQLLSVFSSAEPSSSQPVCLQPAARIPPQILVAAIHGAESAENIQLQTFFSTMVHERKIGPTLASSALLISRIPILRRTTGTR